MRRSEATGPIVPGWIREAVRRQEEAWPFRLLAAAAVVALAAGLLSGVTLWTSRAAVFYAFP